MIPSVSPNPLLHSTASIVLAVSSTSFVSPAYSLTPSEVSGKLASVIVYAPVDEAQPETPLMLSFVYEGKKRDVYFAAFSPSAVKVVLNERLGSNNSVLAKSLKFAPFSLPRFDKLVQPKLSGSSGPIVQYVPDPLQQKVAEGLFLSQGFDAVKAKQVSSSIPTIFCPKPSFSITPKTGNLKGQTFVPCSTSSGLIDAFVQKANASPSLKDKAKLLAIPLPSFFSLLAKGSAAEVGRIRVLPTEADVKLIKKIQNQSDN